MSTLRSLIQSPNALFTFEAAGRHLSFARAAEELNVTQSAVSYAIKQLEQSLGVSLFYRGHRSVELTDAGERFFHDVSMALNHIHHSALELARTESHSNVTLSCSTAFANYWVVPRLARFHEANPDIDLRLQTTDKDIDLQAENIPLGIRRGSGHWFGHEAAMIAKEAVYPVASPAYLKKYSYPTAPEEFPDHALIHLEEAFRERPDWHTWFKHQGVAWEDKGEGLRLNDYALVIQAVLAGEGIALGWWHLVDEMVHHGLLEVLHPESFHGGADFWVIWPSSKPLTPEAAKVRDWFISRQAPLPKKSGKGRGKG